jgi:predicted kinase
MRRTHLPRAVALPALAAALALSGCAGEASGDQPIVVDVRQGPFEATVTVTGELQARHSLDIQGPTGLRQAGIWQVSITDLVDEGTRVKEGDYVGTLDRSEASSKLKALQSELDKTLTQRKQAVLDSTLTLREAREQLINLHYQLEEARITLDQSVYEPPAIIRQAEIALEKAERAYDQAVENYDIKRDKERARLEEIETTLSLNRSEVQDLVNLLDQFEVRAPASGMIIYERNWDGSPRGVGATISPWQSTVATLPDLSSMISQTYINEVDVSRIREGQTVAIGVDAFPDRAYTGQVLSVANIGEQRPNSDAKVFEVRIAINEQDTTLRPAMTTSNTIVTARRDTALYVPSEAVFRNDSLTYVYLDGGRGLVRREVVTGMFNENETVLLAGVSAGERVRLSAPVDAADAGWETLAPDAKERALAEARREQAPPPVAKSDTPRGTGGWPGGGGGRGSRGGRPGR